MNHSYQSTAETEAQLNKAVRELTAGRTVAIPTETVYGLAANAYDGEAVQRVYAIKNRPAFNPLIVHIGRKAQADELVRDMPATARALMDAFWPGPLTLLLKKRKTVSDQITAGKASVALRMPRHELTLELLRRLPFPLVAPSANRSNHISPTTPAPVRQSLGAKTPFILDGGSCAVGIESTIIGFRKDVPVLYRWGSLSREDIETVAGPLRISTAGSDEIRSPGQLKKHYAPRTPLEICPDLPPRLSQLTGQRVGLLLWTPDSRLSDHPQRILAPDGQLAEGARRLFAALYELDQMDLDLLLAQPAPEEGLGRAINDRLRKAATQ